MAQLFINDNSRLQCGNTELTSGDALTVLVCDEAGRTEWKRTTVEHNGSGYYLTGLTQYSPVGLFAKI